MAKKAKPFKKFIKGKTPVDTTPKLKASNDVTEGAPVGGNVSQTTKIKEETMDEKNSLIEATLKILGSSRTGNAFEDAKRLKEEAYITDQQIDAISRQPLDELSNKTLSSYIDKASKDVEDKKKKVFTTKFKEKGVKKKDHDSDVRKFRNRTSGVSKAFMKMEEVEQIDELSKKTLGSYAKKAKDMMGDAENIKGGTQLMTDKVFKLHRYIKNRRKGINTAIDKLTKEDIQLSQAELDHINNILNTTK